MKLRVAKKILKAQREYIAARKELVKNRPRWLLDQKWSYEPFDLPRGITEPTYTYSAGQSYRAAMRLFAWAGGHNESLRHEVGYMIPANRVRIDDSFDLARETAGGRADRKAYGIPEPKPAPVSVVPAPVFRRDGQTHNFNALPFPGRDPRHSLTRKQYDARYQGARPVPVHGSHTFEKE